MASPFIHSLIRHVLSPFLVPGFILDTWNKRKNKTWFPNLETGLLFGNLLVRCRAHCVEFI